MRPPLIAWVPFILSVPVAVAYVWHGRRDRVFPFIGYSLMASVVFSTMQVVLVSTGHQNVLLQYTWPIATTLLLIWGINKYATDSAAMTAMLLMLGFLVPMAIVGPDIVIRPVAGILLASALWRSDYHRTGLEVGLWVYYILPLPALVVVRFEPGLFDPVFIYYRTCHLAGVLMLAGWGWTRVYGLPRPLSFLASRSSLSLHLQTPSTSSGEKSRPSPSTSKLRKI